MGKWVERSLTTLFDNWRLGMMRPQGNDMAARAFIEDAGQNMQVDEQTEPANQPSDAEVEELQSALIQKDAERSSLIAKILQLESDLSEQKHRTQMVTDSLARSELVGPEDHRKARKAVASLLQLQDLNDLEAVNFEQICIAVEEKLREQASEIADLQQLIQTEAKAGVKQQQNKVETQEVTIQTEPFALQSPGGLSP